MGERRAGEETGKTGKAPSRPSTARRKPAARGGPTQSGPSPAKSPISPTYEAGREPGPLRRG